MDNRNKNRARKTSKKREALGLLALELAGVVGLAVLLTVAQGQRAAAVGGSQVSNAVVPLASGAVETEGDWHSHDPRFTQVIGDLWEAGF